MKLKNALFTAVTAVLLILSVTSCQMFTSSPIKFLAKDLSEALDKAKATEIVDSLDDATKEQKADLLASLGKKTPEELKSLPEDQKQAILEAQVDASIDMTAVLGVVNSLNDTTDKTSTVKTVMSAVTPVDTKATSVLLEDSLNSNGTLKNASEETKETVSMAAVAVISSEISANNVDVDALPDATQQKLADFLVVDSNAAPKTQADAENLAKEILGSAAVQNPDSVKSMTTSLMALQAAGGLDTLQKIAG